MLRDLLRAAFHTIWSEPNITRLPKPASMSLLSCSWLGRKTGEPDSEIHVEPIGIGPCRASYFDLERWKAIHVTVSQAL